MRKSVVWAGLTLLGVSVAWAGENDRLRAIGTGRGLYLTHCASCHGGRALGTTAEMNEVGVDVPDLTLIGQRHGKFSGVAVKHYIENKDSKAPMLTPKRACNDSG